MCLRTSPTEYLVHTLQQLRAVPTSHGSQKPALPTVDMLCTTGSSIIVTLSGSSFPSRVPARGDSRLQRASRKPDCRSLPYRRRRNQSYGQVLLGLPYDGAIDIWSLGCISVELFLGLPIFPGVSDHNQICRIVEMTGSLPDFMLENGKDTLKFFKRVRWIW